MLMFGFLETDSLSFKVCLDEDSLNSKAIALLLPKDCFLARYCRDNSIPFSLYLDSKSSFTNYLSEIVAHLNLGCEYVLCDSLYTASEVQGLVEKYVLDMKVLLLSTKDTLRQDIQSCLENGIDGLIDKACILPKA
ncbi:hypothetical protein [Helicobacter sp. 11S02629-2]|uniref:hypothetical protein n=1 Tax=Helicobacter sp. 11S02629-2 TaxID=1476195 RepID=UPI000BA5565F|nr:hypothetical protein [Helicobacter sp. 11S02629-2]PAF45521.1 hypothetical protein BKH40_03410 [Helicobacter sp. 11S02629-2]